MMDLIAILLLLAVVACLVVPPIIMVRDERRWNRDAKQTSARVALECQQQDQWNAHRRWAKQEESRLHGLVMAALEDPAADLDTPFTALQSFRGANAEVLGLL